jgi:NAD(P)-dependent dehydrogenase (short-subunit alcohol dehydrogenase family)
MTKSVIITGATSGMGLAATQLFADRGYEVFPTYRSKEAKARLPRGSNVHPVQMDVTKPLEVHEGVLRVADVLGADGLYALVNNAGITYTAPFEFADADRGREVLEVNLMAPFTVTQAFLPLLMRHNRNSGLRSRVVNVGSWAGTMASPFIPFYNASKSGLVGLTESMYYDLKLLGIHAVLAVPGVTKTPLLEKTTADGTASLTLMPPEGQARYGAYIDRLGQLGRESSGSRFLPDPEKVANKLFRVVEARSPRHKSSLSADAWLIDGVLSRFLPWSLRARFNARMYRLKFEDPRQPELQEPFPEIDPQVTVPVVPKEAANA